MLSHLKILWVAAVIASGLGAAHAQTSLGAPATPPPPPFRVAKVVPIDEAFARRYFKYFPTAAIGKPASDDQNVRAFARVCGLAIEKLGGQVTTDCSNKQAYMRALLLGWDRKTNTYENPLTKVTREIGQAEAELARYKAGEKPVSNPPATDEDMITLISMQEDIVKTYKDRLARLPSEFPDADVALMKKLSRLVKDRDARDAAAYEKSVKAISAR